MGKRDGDIQQHNYLSAQVNRIMPSLRRGKEAMAGFDRSATRFCCCWLSAIGAWFQLQGEPMQVSAQAGCLSECLPFALTAF